MANGVIVPSQAVWRGEVEIAGVKAQGEFEVFDSGSGWKFLFGKPMLHAFKAIHNYETDQVDITGKGGTRTLLNQSLARKPTIDEAAEEIQELETHQEKQEMTNPKLNQPMGRKSARSIGGRRWKASEESKKRQSVSNEDSSTNIITPTEVEVPICILTEDGEMPEESVKALLKEIPVGFLENDNAIFT